MTHASHMQQEHLNGQQHLQLQEEQEIERPRYTLSYERCSEDGQETCHLTDTLTGQRRIVTGDKEGLIDALSRGLLTTRGILGGDQLWESYERWRSSQGATESGSSNHDRLREEASSKKIRNSQK